MSRATIFDVAERAGVSIKTVSRVVNNEPNVKATTRERVSKAIEELSYRPDRSARVLAGNRTHLIGLVYDDPANYEVPSAGYVIRMQQGALDACRAANCELLIHPCNYRDKNVGQQLRSMIGNAKPDGIVLAAPLSNIPRIIRAIGSTDTPYVRISSGQKNRKQFAVSMNDHDCSAEMTRYLASLGHRRIAFINGDPMHAAVQIRYDGYVDGLQQSGIEFDKDLVFAGDNSIGSGEAGANVLLSLQKPPTAIFAANDDMAAGVIRVADRLGIDVPGQLSVAGCDDVALARQVYPALTTIRQPLSAMAKRATEELIQHSRGKSKLSGEEILPAKLVVRDSTGKVPS